MILLWEPLCGRIFHSFFQSQLISQDCSLLNKKRSIWAITAHSWDSHSLEFVAKVKIVFEAPAWLCVMRAAAACSALVCTGFVYLFLDIDPGVLNALLHRPWVLGVRQGSEFIHTQKLRQALICFWDGWELREHYLWSFEPFIMTQCCSDVFLGIHGGI